MSAALLLVCLIAIFGAVFVGAQGPCGGADWKYSPHNQKCYKLFDTKIGWTMAEFKCVYMGAHHISIHDLNDNEFLTELARPVGLVWLGSAQFGTSPNYVYSDRTPFIFEHWNDARRPNYHKGRKCIKMDAATGGWVQSCCKVPAAFICQKNAVQLPGAIIEDTSDMEEVDAASAINNNELRKRSRVRAAAVRRMARV